MDKETILEKCRDFFESVPEAIGVTEDDIEKFLGQVDDMLSNPMVLERLSAIAEDEFTQFLHRLLAQL